MDAQAALLGGPCARNRSLLPLATIIRPIAMWVRHLGAAPPAPAKPSDETAVPADISPAPSSLQRDLGVRSTWLSHSRIPGPQEPCEITNVYCCFKPRCVRVSSNVLINSRHNVLPSRLVLSEITEEAKWVTSSGATPAACFLPTSERPSPSLALCSSASAFADTWARRLIRPLSEVLSLSFKSFKTQKGCQTPRMSGPGEISATDEL